MHISRAGKMMKGPILAMIAILLSNQVLWAVSYDSIFGFTVAVPPGWQVLDRRSISDSNDERAAIEASREDSVKNTNKNWTGRVKDMVVAGNIEYYVNSAYPDAVISVTAGTGRVPNTAYAVSKTCNALPKALSKYSGKRIRVYMCKSEVVDRRAALYSAFDGLRSGTRSFQYQLQKSRDQVLVMTATCPKECCDTVSNQFDDMVKSVNLQ